MPKNTIIDMKGGFNGTMPPHLIADDELSDVSNMVYRKGIWRKRDGFTLPYSATGDTNEVVELYEHTDVNGTVTMLAATKTNLYRLSGTSWVSMYNSGTGTTKDKWFIASFNDTCFATNGVDGVLEATNVTGGSFSGIGFETSTDAAGNQGHNITNVGGLLIFNSRLCFWDTTDATDGHVPKRFQWSEVLNFDRVHAGSNYVDMPISNSRIMHCRPMGRGLLSVYQPDCVNILQDTGDPLYFVPRFTQDGVGLIGEKAVASTPAGDIFCSDEGFFTFQGGGIISIGDDKIVDWFFENLDEDNKANVYGWTDWRNREIEFLLPTNGDEPDAFIRYNWQYDNWTKGTFDGYCGFHRFLGLSTPLNYHGTTSGNVKQSDSSGSRDDNGTSISTSVRTKAFRNMPNPQEPDAPEYIKIRRIETDADPTTANIFFGEHDLGRETPDTTKNSMVSLTDNDGHMRYADVMPVDGRYFTLGIDDADEVSEFVAHWSSGGHI